MAPLRRGTKVGSFVIKQTLPEGDGGMAQVYLAHHIHRPEEQVALKIALPEFSEFIKNEAEKLQQLRHTRLVHVLPVGHTRIKEQYAAKALELEGEPWYFVMEYLAGGSLRTYLSRHKHLAVEEAVEIASQVADALAYLHSQPGRIVHQDVKPENIMFRRSLDRDPCPDTVLVDFGISRCSDQRQIPAGSLPYMSPERIRMVRGESVLITDRADVYSLGTVLYEMLAGKPAFSGHKNVITSDILAVYPKPVADIPGDLNQLIQWGLQKDPAARPSAFEFGQQLNRIVPPHIREMYCKNKPVKPDRPGCRSRVPQVPRGPLIFFGGMAIVACPACLVAAGVLVAGVWLNPLTLPTPSPTRVPVTTAPTTRPTLTATPILSPTATLGPTVTPVPTPSPTNTPKPATATPTPATPKPTS